MAAASAHGSRIVIEHAFLIPWNEEDAGTAGVKGDSPIFAETKIGTVPIRSNSASANESPRNWTPEGFRVLRLWWP